MTDHAPPPTDRSPDALLRQIADFVCDALIDSSEARATAAWALFDSLGCAMLALRHPACTRLLGPLVAGNGLPGGSRVPGTNDELDPVQAAFNIGAMIRWLDYNDTWLAAEWGHPSDNFGAILAVADYLDRRAAAGEGRRITVGDVLDAGIKAYEIQGVLALGNAFNRVGLDHVLLVRVASTAVVTAMLGGGRDQIVNAVSNAWLDGGALRTYRHAPNTGSRKSWAAGDAASRAVRLALMAMQGEPGYPTALSAPRWGFCDVVLNGASLNLQRPLGSYVMEHVLFKVLYPAEFHGQTAVEAAIALHPAVYDRLDAVAEVVIHTQESAMRIIDKTGPLHNPADRDHCIQYMTTIALIFGELTDQHYEDDVAADPRIDALRAKMTVREEPRYSRDYLDPQKRSIPNAVQVRFRDGTSTDRVEVEYPLGHKRRRAESLPHLRRKLGRNLAAGLSESACRTILSWADHAGTIDDMPIDELLQPFVPPL